MATLDRDRMRGMVATGGAAAAVGFVAFLPFLRGALGGRCFFFRDLSVHFFPLRRFVADGLRAGELRFWNPYVHEGVPLSLPPVSYPLDLLQALLPDERGFSLLLALHVPLAALAFLALARGLGVGRVAAAGGALVYGLGGFCLSTLNLYVYLHASAWAPLVILALLRAAAGGWRPVALAAGLVAVALSTTGIEIVAQTVLFGLVLSSWGRPASRALRLGSALALGAALAAPTIVFMSGLVEGTERGKGFPTDVVLSHSIHPLTFLQVVIGSFYGDLSRLAELWWGQNFFPRGFPYVLSLYLGLTALAVAAVGACHGRPLRARLLALLALGTLVSLGQWAGLGAVVDALPLLRTLRFPAKAFFTVHVSVALLVALGLDALVRNRRGWGLLTALALSLGGLLAAAPGIPSAFPGFTRWFVGGFFPPAFPLALRLDRLRLILDDASRGGVVAVAAGLLAALVVARRLAPPRASFALAALISLDLLRTGAGLNPMVTSSFYELSPEMRREAAPLREGRTFTCDPEQSLAYDRARAARGDDHEVWTFFTSMETLTPSFSMRVPVRTALSLDLTMLVPVSRLLTFQEGGCRDFARIVDRVRAAGVSHVLSLDPITHPDLRLRNVVAPPRIAPLVVHVYELERPLPLREVFGGRVLSLDDRPGRIEMEVEAPAPTAVVVRDAYAPGWSAAVNGFPVPVRLEAGRHCAVPVPGGRSRVLLTYESPRIRAGLLISLLAGATTAALAFLPLAARRRPSEPRPEAEVPREGT